MRKIIIGSFPVLIAFLLASCQTFSDIPIVREFHKKIELNENSTIYFENVHGDLEIYGWKKDSVEIRAEKTGTDTQLRQTDIDLKKKGSTLFIKTLFPRADIRSVFVHYELRVPQNILFKGIKIKKGDMRSFQIYGELFAKLEEGNIEIEDFSGTCNLFTENGNIVARIYGSRANDDFTFKTNEGDISLFVPPSLDARIEAETRQGEIHSDFAPEEKEEEPIKKWDTTFGQGKAKIKINSWNGNIQVKKIQL